MQLLLAFALFLLCRNPEYKRLMDEVQPYLGDEFGEALKGAEELSRAAFGAGFDLANDGNPNTSAQNGDFCGDVNIPLKPIAGIADGKTLAALAGALDKPLT